MTESVIGQRHDRSALVLYGSQTGNSQDVAEQLGRVAERLHFVTRVSEMDLVEIVCSSLQSPAVQYTCSCTLLTQKITGHPLKTHCCDFRNLDNWARRIPEECEEVLEKSSQKAFAFDISGSRVFHHIRSRG